ncbi:MAG: hypothetical protein ACC628_14500 [Pirellulaceae bacterium]
MSKPQQDPLLVPAKDPGDLSAPELVDRLCVEQRTRWLQGDPVRVEALLERYPLLRNRGYLQLGFVRPRRTGCLGKRQPALAALAATRDCATRDCS